MLGGQARPPPSTAGPRWGGGTPPRGIPHVPAPPPLPSKRRAPHPVMADSKITIALAALSAHVVVVFAAANRNQQQLPSEFSQWLAASSWRLDEGNSYGLHHFEQCLGGVFGMFPLSVKRHSGGDLSRALATRNECKQEVMAFLPPNCRRPPQMTSVTTGRVRKRSP